MSVFANPQEHTDNPPSTWEVHKRGPRSWALTTSGGRGTLDVFGTRTAALEARTAGFLFNLYNKETRWYAGEHVAGWRDYMMLMPTLAAAEEPCTHELTDAEGDATLTNEGEPT